jgi:hypothetical protein
MGTIRVGEPDVRPDFPSHVTGVRQGNEKGAYDKQMGHHADGTADARRSTGLRPKEHDAILKTMPNLPPG